MFSEMFRRGLGPTMQIGPWARVLFAAAFQYKSHLENFRIGRSFSLGHRPAVILIIWDSSRGALFIFTKTKTLQEEICFSKRFVHDLGQQYKSALGQGSAVSGLPIQVVLGEISDMS